MAKIREDVANPARGANEFNDYVEALHKPVEPQPTQVILTREEIKWGDRYGRAATPNYEMKSAGHQPTRVVPKQRASQSS